MVLHDEDLKYWLSYLETLPNTRANRRFKVICNTLLDFETNEILVSKTLMWKSANKRLGIKGEMICKQAPKTDSGYRKVAVPPIIMATLKEFHNEMTAYFEKHSLPQSKLIFPTIYGNYMCDRNERATLKKTLILARVT